MTLRKFAQIGLLLALTALMVGLVNAQQGGTPKLAPRSAYSAAPSTGFNGTLPAGITTTPLTTQNRAELIAITHSNDQVVQPFNGVACVAGEALYHFDNSFIRAFKLSDFAITTDVQVRNVQIGIEASLPENGVGDTQPISVRLYVLKTGDSVVISNLTFISSADYLLPEINSTANASYYATLPVTGLIFAAETLVVEIYVPEAAIPVGTYGDRFFIGSNSNGQTDESYLLAPDCTVNDITDTADIGYPNMHVVMNVEVEPVDTTDGIVYQMLTNGGFETDLDGDKLPDAWAPVNLTSDGVKTDKVDKPFAFEGERAFRFKGGEGEDSKISQNVDMTPYTVIAGDQLYFSAALEAANLTEGARIKLRVKYTSTSNPTGKVNLDIAPGTYAYGIIETSVLNLAGGVSKFKVQIENRALSGKLLVDSTQLLWAVPAATRRERGTGVDGLIPLPAAAQ
ncbi:MAG: hypothetical protein H7Y11_13070 [Armatimonadetes bacterium]|nr:hypothetical protein [Anaerolineae bacterium]